MTSAPTPSAASSLRRWAWRLLRIGALLYLGLAALLWLAQDSLIFRPPHPSGAPVVVSGVKDGSIQPLELTRDGTTLRGWIRQAPGRGPHPTILYFGGNAERLEQRVAREARRSQEGWNFACMAYRGYGPSGGKLGVATLEGDALACWDLIVARPEVDPSRVAVWGSSLGCGPALCVASQRKAAALILFAPWTSFADIGASRYPFLPIGWLLKADLQALEHARAVRTRCLVVHGHLDRTIPFALGQRIAGALPPDTTFIELPTAGHAFSTRDPRVAGPFTATLAAVAGAPSPPPTLSPR